MVLFGEKFDYGKVHLTKEQERVSSCRAEAARKGREQARRWAARKRRQTQGQADGHPAHGTHAGQGVHAPQQVANSPRPEHSNDQSASGQYYCEEYYTGGYHDGESLVVQFVAGELHDGESPAAQFIVGQFENGDSLGLFLIMTPAGSAD